MKPYTSRDSLSRQQIPILASITVLPQEDPNEFASLLAALVQEHQQGATETHLMEELAGIIWLMRCSIRSGTGRSRIYAIDL